MVFLISNVACFVELFSLRTTLEYVVAVAPVLISDTVYSAPLIVSTVEFALKSSVDAVSYTHLLNRGIPTG